MGFGWWAEEQRVRINLSEHACLIMEEDMYQFDVKERSSFMNTVFRNYRMDAPASISIYLQNKRIQLREQLMSVITDSFELERTLSYLLEKEQQALTKRIKMEMCSRHSGNSYRINNENFAYLTSVECTDADYYNQRPGLYIKCILEEYSTLPFIEREKIYFSDMYNTAFDAIQTNTLLKVRTKGDKLFHIYPYSMETDSLSSRLYLTGFSKGIAETGSSKTPASFRIPRLKSITRLRQNGRLTNEEKTEIKEAIKNKSVQFLLSNEEEIHVRLTKRGIQKYNNQLYLRPAKNKELSSEYVYVFNCTEQQAEYYFFKFGEDAEILKPETLRKRFIDMYQQAWKRYVSS